MFSKQEKDAVTKWHVEFKLKKNTRNKTRPKTDRQEWYELNPFPFELKLLKLYDSGVGLKRLAKSLSVSYSDMRTLMVKYIKKDIRRGYRVITDELRRFRSEMQKNNKNNNFRDWPNKKPSMVGFNSGNIQGYYLKKGGEYIWIRSTLEYTFAKWLDKNEIEWDYEPDRFRLGNGENYRPDFRIKNKGKYEYIEIKGRYHTDNKIHKPKMLSDMGIQITLIDDLTEYQEQSYKKELQEWKQVRLSKEELPKKQQNQTKMCMI